MYRPPQETCAYHTSHWNQQIREEWLVRTELRINTKSSIKKVMATNYQNRKDDVYELDISFHGYCYNYE